MRSCRQVSDPVYAPNSKGGRAPTPPETASRKLWYSDGDMVHAALTLHAEDDDGGQAGTLVREVMDNADRERLVSDVVGRLRNGVSETASSSYLGMVVAQSM